MSDPPASDDASRALRTAPGSKARWDDSGDVLRRGPGCLLAIVVFSVVFTLLEPTVRGWPRPAHYAVPAAIGLAMAYLYVAVARSRWGLRTPGAVRLALRDLFGIVRRSADDARVDFAEGTPWKERLLHELLWAGKWAGHLALATAIALGALALVRALGQG